MNAEPKNPIILVLGTDGMVGRTVYKYLKSRHPKTIYGTTRTVKFKKDFYKFDAYTYKKDLEKIIRSGRHIDFIINCIGILKEYHSVDDLIYVNSSFPHKLLEFSNKQKINVIHISTDAVFSELSGPVNEKSSPSPCDLYGASKLLGELSSRNAITVRTSLIGFDPIKHKGLLEWINKEKVVKGYVNQLWTGCTSLQFAQFCEELVKDNKFEKLRKKCSIIHFSPLGPLSKYKLIKTYIKLSEQPVQIKKSYGKEINRFLTSYFFDFSKTKKYTTNINSVIKELIDFEK